MLEGLRNWWAAEPWRVYPLARTGWRYRNIYRAIRDGAWSPERERYLSGGEPHGWLASLWGAIRFPHVHEHAEYEDLFEPDWTVPPGETIVELMQERDVTPEGLARKMLEPLNFVVGLLSGERPITMAVALDLEEIFGVSVDFWLNLEQRYREDLARLHPGCTVDLAHHPAVRNLAAESGIDVTRCEFCSGPLDADHPWRRGMDGACAHEECL